MAAQLVKIDLSREPGVDDIYWVVAKLKVDNEEIFAVVDSGAWHLFFVWKHWYESVHPKGCETLLFKCYECSPAPCTPGVTTKITFVDGTTVSIFKESGQALFNGRKTSIDFGLIANYKAGTGSVEPHASLGLGRVLKPESKYRPLIEQLTTKKVIGSSAFSLYLKPGGPPTGQLILGGDDPTLYKGPLTFLDLVEDDLVAFTGFGVGGASCPKVVAQGKADLDTGTQSFIVPQSLYDEIIGYLGTRGSKKVPITKSGPELYQVACSDRQYMPDITFFLRGAKGEDVPLVVTPDVYVRPPMDPEQDECLILISAAPEGIWVLGNPVLIGRYFYYHWEENKIGVADLR
ncbi:hypothetical protein FOL46_003321 [Perkinsus olseni]|uniref:Peptidase A1 domain-containing protein n=1 Tax=Perkinsus olseni TaxID=32597 RepID=A0A7J6M3G0_PEROL|nr:hypothetical protein FOL46_003321 [Perkinsus olseni]